MRRPDCSRLGWGTSERVIGHATLADRGEPRPVNGHRSRAPDPARTTFLEGLERSKLRAPRPAHAPDVAILAYRSEGRRALLWLKGWHSMARWPPGPGRGAQRDAGGG